MVSSYIKIFLIIILSMMIVGCSSEKSEPIPTDTPTNSSTPTSTITQTPTSTFTSTSTGTPTLTYTITPKPTPNANIDTGYDCVPVGTKREVGIVVKVIDGDTIVVNIDGEDFYVRYIGIDSPEPSEYLGTSARMENNGLVAGRWIILIKDISETDIDDRLLRYVFVSGIFVNYELVLKGWTKAENYPPDESCVSLFNSAGNEAQKNGAGIWKVTKTPVPSPKPSPEPSLQSSPQTSPLPTSTTSTGGGDGDGGSTGVCSCSSDTYNCSDFNTHNQAQACYDYCVSQRVGDIHGLDRDDDGLACESLP